MKKVKTISLILVLIFAFQKQAISQLPSSEILKITAEENNLIIDVAKNYPQFHFSSIPNENKIQIELLNTKYHNNFNFDLPTKNNILEGLSFIDNVSIGISENSSNSKVVITLNNSSELKLEPKLLSTKNNKVQIGFIQSYKENKPGLQEDPKIIKRLEENEILKNQYNQAIEEYTSGNLLKAEELYKDIISRDSNFYIARYNLAKIYFDKGSYDLVLDELSNLVEEIKEKNNSEKNKKLLLLAKNILGSIYFYKNDYSTALEQFNEILLLDPGFSEAYFNIGIIKEKEKELTEAIASFEKAQKLNPSNPEIYYHLGILNVLTENKESAIDNFKKVTELTNEKTEINKSSKLELKKLMKK